MSEQHMRRRVIQWLKPLGAIPVENPAQPGTPDVNYIEGWIELKKLHGWPKDKAARVPCQIFTPQQRNWLKLRCMKGGRAFLLVQVKNEWLLFDGAVAAEHFGHINEYDCKRLALKWWPKGLQPEQLREIITS